ncbi:MAG: HAMP domain-containing protein [Legionella sp.]|nr:HAMP domain-containing protein [Legionella sp.]
MRSLYWKIFLTFWLASILIIVTTAWVTSQITQKSSLPVGEHMFMDSYANAAVATFESGQREALLNWLKKIGASRHMTLYLLSSTGEILSTQPAPSTVKAIGQNLIKDQLSEGIFKSGKLLVSHEIMSTSGKYYRLVAITENPIHYFIQIPWAGLTLRLLLATFISGLICYFLSLYLTQPLRSLGLAAKSIATGNFGTRVGHLRGHNKDEIGALSDEFDSMAEQLEALIRSKDRLLQDISHELRSPLTRLNIAIELGRQKTNHLADTEFNRMELECLRLNALIGEILDFARLDKSTAGLQLSTVNLTELISGIIQDANYESGENHNHVKQGITEPCQIKADARLIHRAIENIVRNALHYSPADKDIIISMKHNASKDSIFIDIRDCGPGVPNSQLTNIFNPFYRVDTSRAKKTGGFGLGLAIAARAIHLHRGDIKASNNTEGGLLVRISLPIEPNHSTEDFKEAGTYS